MADDKIRKFGKNFKFNFHAEWKIFAWCLLIATVLWLLTALNETYLTRLNIRVNYYNYPKNNVFTQELPEEFRISVNGKGWDLLGIILRGGIENINIDLGQFRQRSFIVTNKLKEDIRNQLSEKMVINDISPDTIKLVRETKLTKKVPVVLNLHLAFPKQYGLGNKVAFNPDSIIISGPHSLIKNIKQVETVPLTLRELKTETIKKINLRKPASSAITYNSRVIQVRIPVYQLTEDMAEVPVEIINKKFPFEVQLIPQKVSVIYQTSLNKFENIEESLFEIVVDGSAIDTISKKPLKVQLVNKPEFTYNVRLKPDYVNFVIKKTPSNGNTAAQNSNVKP